MTANAIKTKIVQDTVERYNLIKSFLDTFGKESDKQFALFLIIEIIKSLKSDSLVEYDRILSFVKRAVE